MEQNFHKIDKETLAKAPPLIFLTGKHHKVWQDCSALLQIPRAGDPQE